MFAPHAGGQLAHLGSLLRCADQPTPQAVRARVELAAGGTLARDDSADARGRGRFRVGSVSMDQVVTIAAGGRTVQWANRPLNPQPNLQEGDGDPTNNLGIQTGKVPPNDCSLGQEHSEALD